jgi:hypothetical protein
MRSGRDWPVMPAIRQLDHLVRLLLQKRTAVRCELAALYHRAAHHFGYLRSRLRSRKVERIHRINAGRPNARRVSHPRIRPEDRFGRRR